MRPVHLLRVGGAPEDYASLIEAAAIGELRIGWLELTDVDAASSLMTAAELGALRAVAAGPRRTVSVKSRQGPAVIGDLLREHFRGCRAVLVMGDLEAPLLQPDSGGWIVTAVDGRTRRYGTGELLSALRRTRPFPSRPQRR